MAQLFYLRKQARELVQKFEDPNLAALASIVEQLCEELDEMGSQDQPEPASPNTGSGKQKSDKSLIH